MPLWIPKTMKEWTSITHYAGFDWARDHHAVVVVNQQGQIVADFEFPTPQALVQAGRRRWEKFLHTHRLWRPETASRRLEIFARADQFVGSPPIVQAKSQLALSLCKLLRTLQQQLEEYRKQIEELFARHPDHDLFGSLPGVKRVLAPRLLAGIGSDPARYAHQVAVLQAWAGTAPISFQSGRRHQVKMRWTCDKFLRHQMSQLSMSFCFALTPQFLTAGNCARIPLSEPPNARAKPCREICSRLKAGKGERTRGGNILAQLFLLSAILSAPLAAVAQATTEADQIRDELRQLKQDYQQRIDRLEERLRRLETPAAATNPATPTSVSRDKIPTHAVETAQSTNAAAAARQFANEQFREDIETREGVLATDSQPVRERLEQVLQDFMDIHAYIRAGYGRDDKGGPQVAFGAPGALSKYRLGNEAENYGELTFGKNFYVPDLFSLEPRERPDGTPSGPIARVQLTISMYNPYQELLSSQDTTFGLPEAFASIGNVVADQPSMKFWAGSRYYRRNDIHITDFFFYNMSGTGGGIEDFQLPFGKMAFAWIGAASSSGFSDLPQPDAQNKAGFSKANYDLRLYDVPLPLGKGEFGVDYARADSGLDAYGRSAPNSQGAAFTFMHTVERFISLDGFNKFSFQFGTGPAKTFTSGFETFVFENGLFIRPEANNSWRFRATEHFVADVNEHFSIGPALVYQITDYTDNGGMAQWASAGVRPILRFNKFISLALETGVDWVKNNDAGTSDYLWKVTLAPQVSLGSQFFSRPVVRCFVTYAHWGDQFRGQVGGLDYQNENQGLTYGVQMEAWW